MIECLSHLRFSYRITLVRTRMDWSRQFCFYSSETSQISLILSLKRMTTLYLLLAFLVGCRINDITTLTQAGYGQHVNSMDLSTVQPSTDRGIESAASIFPGSSLVSNNSGHVGEKPGGSSRSNGSLVMDRVIGDNMPSVFTKGDGPNGKIVEGFLYKYKKVEEVRIVCVCHGIFLTPAEFIKHAGGTDVAHPLRHIVVKPSASLL